jgi:hypothetical protein
LGGQLGLVVGGQRDEFGSAPFEFGALFGPLSAELLGDLFALIARLLFALFELFVGGVQVRLVLVQLLSPLTEFGGLLMMSGLQIVQLGLFPLQPLGKLIQLGPLRLDLGSLPIEFAADRFELFLRALELSELRGQVIVLLS